MTAEGLCELLATLLSGAAGGKPEGWSKLIGQVEKRPSVENIHSNWRIAPTAKGKDLEAIDKAAAIVRAEHPYVD